MWGLGQRLDLVGSRFIPTRVGTTGEVTPKGWVKPGSSPRVWGLRRKGCGCPCLHRGSSPRVWGLLYLILHLFLGHRFILTRVGTTSAALYPVKMATGPGVVAPSNEEG
jgi:hypothetical protein